MWSRVRSQVRRPHSALLSIPVTCDGVISISLDQFDRIAQRFSFVSHKTPQKHSTWLERPRRKCCTEHGFARETKQTFMRSFIRREEHERTDRMQSFQKNRFPPFLGKAFTVQQKLNRSPHRLIHAFALAVALRVISSRSTERNSTLCEKTSRLSADERCSSITVNTTG